MTSRVHTPNAQGHSVWFANFVAGSAFNQDWTFENYDPATGTVTGAKDFTGWDESSLEMELSWDEGGAKISTFSATLTFNEPRTDGGVNIQVASTVTQALQTAGKAESPNRQHGHGVIRGKNAQGDYEDLKRGRFRVGWVPE